MTWLLALNVILSWAKVETNIDGSKATIHHYNVYSRNDGSSYPRKPILTRTGNQATISISDACRSKRWFSVSAVDTQGHEGDKSQEVVAETRVEMVTP